MTFPCEQFGFDESMSKHPHNQIILQSNQMKLLHFREALGGEKDTFSSSFANPEHSQSSLGGGHVCSPSLSRFLALEGHFVPKQNYSELLFQAKCVKDESLKIKRDDASVLSDSTAKFSSPYTLGLLQPKYGDFSLLSQRFTTSTGTFIAKNLLTCLFLQVKEKELKEISS